MNNFKISIISRCAKRMNGILTHINQITIGNYKETCYMPLKDWRIKDYKKQWQDAIERIKFNETSCIVVYVLGLKTKPMIWIWPMYKVGNKIFFHNKLLINQTVKACGFKIKLKDFNLQNCYEFISERIVNENNEAIGSEGEKLFEKSIDYNDLFNED